MKCYDCGVDHRGAATEISHSQNPYECMKNLRILAEERGELIDNLFVRISNLTQDLNAAKEALRPFAHPDLCKLTGGTVQGNDSPIYARDKAILKIGDFVRARNFLNGTK